MEEIGVPAVFLGKPIPHFITVTQTNGQGQHTDVSLWYVLQLDQSTQLTIEPDRFADVRWWNIDDILTTPITQFDPELHRFIIKLKRTLL